MIEKILLPWFLSVLAVYRLAYLTTIDNGPAHLFLQFRSRISKLYGPDSWQAEGASCLFCQSVWYAMIPAALIPHSGVAEFVLLWLSIAGAVAVLHWVVLALMAVVNR